MAYLAEASHLEQRVLDWLEASDKPPHQLRSRKRRRPLGEVTANMQTPPRQKAKYSRNTDDSAVGAPQAVNAVIRSVAQEAEDETPTPRPIQNLPFLRPLSQTNFSPHSNPSSSNNSSRNSEADSTASGSSRKRKRPTSPSKKMALLRQANFGIKEKMVPDRLEELNQPLQLLFERMSEISIFVGIIPSERKDDFRAYTDGLDLDRMVSPDRAKIGDLPSLSAIKRIVEYTAANITRHTSEAAWNCNVHAPLLEHALSQSAHQDQLCWDNITTASIDPPDLLPFVTSTDRTASKKADFAINLRFEEEVTDCLAQLGVDSLCQSDYGPLCFSPPAISIETKLRGDNYAEANLQLSTWILAQINKTRELLLIAGRSNVKIPPLPLMIVQGQNWSFLCAEASEKGAILWTGVDFGKTTMVRGVLQVLAALQHCMYWADTVYRPWFEENIIEPLLKRQIDHNEIRGEP